MIPATLTAPASPRLMARQWQRVSVCAPAEILSLQGLRTGLVVNLCAHGAQVELAVPPAPGSEILLFCGGIEAEGSIVWSGPQHCGIRFHTPIEESDIDSEANWSRVALFDLMTR